MMSMHRQFAVKLFDSRQNLLCKVLNFQLISDTECLAFVHQLHNNFRKICKEEISHTWYEEFHGLNHLFFVE